MNSTIMLLAVAVLGLAPDPCAGQAPVDQIEVTLARSKAASLDLVLATFTDEHLSVQRADAAGVVVAAPYQEYGPYFTMTLRAALFTTTPGNTKVILSGTYDYADENLRSTHDQRITSASDGPPGQTWQRLQRIATALRAHR
jgi:hypothetical protein